MRTDDEAVDLRGQRPEDHEGPDADRDAGDGQCRPELSPAEVPQESHGFIALSDPERSIHLGVRMPHSLAERSRAANRRDSHSFPHTSMPETRWAVGTITQR